MGWRKKMGIKQEEIISKTYIQNIQNIQKVEKKQENKAFVPFVPSVVKNQKVKTPKQQHDELWKKAWKLAEFIDNPESEVPLQARAARVPELQEMVMMLSELEFLIKQEGEV